jgi:hypothetical protein
MADWPLRALAGSLACLSFAACDAQGDSLAQSSVTVKLPPARPHVPAPAFSFKAPRKGQAAARF